MQNNKSFGIPNEKELEKINAFSLKTLKADEVFVFSVTLCDNEIDRDFECFDLESLNALAPLFVGKTGIFDHSMKAKDQSCRSFDTYLETSPDKITSTGEPYTRLMARAYCLNIPENRELIKGIEGGIKKEVSVSCSVAKKVCSVCGKDSRTELCEHRGGRFYRSDGKKKLCFHTLSDPTDAYEWSFVAVPAQKQAGVTKNLSELSEIMKTGNSTVIGKSCYDEIEDTVSKMKHFSGIAEEYENEVRHEVISLYAAMSPGLSSDIIKTMTDRLNLDELKKMRIRLKKSVCDIQSPQLIKDSAKADKDFDFYKI